MAKKKRCPEFLKEKASLASIFGRDGGPKPDVILAAWY